MQTVTQAQWSAYEEQGFVKLGKVTSDEEQKALSDRLDEIMLGTADIDYDRLMMQLDNSGDYGSAEPQTMGFKRATRHYRKIQGLELDPLFLAFMCKPIWGDACARVYGADAPTACFRAMFFNKPVSTETPLPWHQDRWHNMDRDPLLTVWLAIDPATAESGCVKVIPGSHRYGVINPSHPAAFITEEQREEFAPDNEVVLLEIEAGEVMLLHNWLLHCSGPNRSDRSRRAFSVCYMDGDTRQITPAKSESNFFPVIFANELTG